MQQADTLKNFSTQLIATQIIASAFVPRQYFLIIWLKKEGHVERMIGKFVPTEY